MPQTNRFWKPPFGYIPLVSSEVDTMLGQPHLIRDMLQEAQSSAIHDRRCPFRPVIESVRNILASCTRHLGTALISVLQPDSTARLGMMNVTTKTVGSIAPRKVSVHATNATLVGA